MLDFKNRRDLDGFAAGSARASPSKTGEARSDSDAGTARKAGPGWGTPGRAENFFIQVQSVIFGRADAKFFANRSCAGQKFLP
jgi:hypothetical protein